MQAISSNLIGGALAEVQHAGDAVLFPLQQYWWFYAVFTLFVLAVLALDLGVFHRQAHEVKYKEAVAWSAVWITLALLFNLGFWFYTSWKLALPECAELVKSMGTHSALELQERLVRELARGHVKSDGD
jgi:hypothetical protein